MTEPALDPTTAVLAAQIEERDRLRAENHRLSVALVAAYTNVEAVMADRDRLRAEVERLSKIGTVKALVQWLATMEGHQLLETLVTYATLYLDAHSNYEAEDDCPVIIRAIQARLAETGIARRNHGEACRFPLGDDQCSCPITLWSWPLKGLEADQP